MKGIVTCSLLVLRFGIWLCLVNSSEAAFDNCTCKDPDESSLTSDYGDCRCFFTDYCQNMPWDQWATSSQGGVHVKVIIIPYYYTTQYNGRDSITDVAYNISFTLKDENVRKLVFRMLEGCYGEDNKCRYYEFSSTVQLTGVTFSNGDFYFSQSVPCSIQVVGLSKDQQPLFYQKFRTVVPLYLSPEERRNIGSWRSLIAIDVTEYQQYLNAQFTMAPADFKVLSYKFRLVENGRPKPWEIISASPTMSMLPIKVGPIIWNNNYSVQVAIHKPYNLTGDCCISTSPPFAFKVETDPSWFIALYVGVTIFCIALIILICTKWFSQNIDLKDEVTVFIVYSFDIAQHQSAVIELADYLKLLCHCKVLLDVWDIKTKDPDIWINDCIMNSDYVLIIWSRGAQLKFREDNTKVFKNEPGYLGHDLFSIAMTKISAKLSQQLSTPKFHRNLNKFINITLSYSPKNVIPSRLDYLPSFHLQKDFNSLICFLHAVKTSRVPFSSFRQKLALSFNCFPKFSISNLAGNPKGRKLLSAMKEMQDLEEMEPGWLDELLEEREAPSLFRNISEVEKLEDQESDKSFQGLDLEMEEPLVPFPPSVDKLPIFGPDVPQSKCSFWPPPANSSPEDFQESNQHLFPPEIFGPVDKNTTEMYR